MAGGFKDFADGNVLTGAEIDSYLMGQTVMRFASAAARDAALAAVVENGMMAYTADNGYWWLRMTGVWVPWQSNWAAYTPTWTNTTTNPVLGNGTISAEWRYQSGQVVARGKITMGSTTTYGTGSQWIIGLPPVLAHVNWRFPAQLGNVVCQQAAIRPRTAVSGAAGDVFVMYDEATGANVSQAAPAAWANGNSLSWALSYRPA